MDEVHNKPITDINVRNAMSMFHEHEGSYNEWKAKLEAEGYAWSMQDARDYITKRSSGHVALGSGLTTGDTGVGASFIANSYDDERGYAICREWQFDKPGSPCTGQFVRAATAKLDADLGISSSDSTLARQQAIAKLETMFAAKLERDKSDSPCAEQFVGDDTEDEELDTYLHPIDMPISKDMFARDQAIIEKYLKQAMPECCEPSSARDLEYPTTQSIIQIKHNPLDSDFDFDSDSDFDSDPDFGL